MSDGPHRSLPMRSRWKAFAKTADKPAFDTATVADKAMKALTQDWREEVGADVLSGLRKVLAATDQIDMFGKDKSAQFDGLREIAAGQPLARTLIECAAKAATRGLNGDAAFEDAALRALSMRLSRGLRQTEEHYLRRSSMSRAVNMRERGEAAARHLDVRSLARRLTKLDSGGAKPRARKMDGLDDGVSL